MATVKKRRVGKQHYYYVEHSFKAGKKVRGLSRYLGKKIPYNVEDIKDDLEYKAIRLTVLGKLKNIKLIENFLIHFIYDSSKIEGSTLSLNDTKGLFLHNITPKNKPVKDVKEAEGYREAFYSMLNFKGQLRLEIVNKWHAMIFKNTMDYIAGKIRVHKIIVTGSRVVFPHPEDVQKLLKGFFNWYKKIGR